MGNKFITYGLLGVFSLMLVFGVLAMSGISPSMSPNSDSVNYQGSVCIYKNGELIECDHNVLFNEGANMTRDCLSSGTCAAMTNITLCNASLAGPAACATPIATGGAFTELTSCMDDFGAGTVSYLNQYGNWTVYKTFTASCDGVLVNTTRIGNSTGTDLAGNTFTLVTLNDNDQLTVNWTLSVR